MSRNSSIRLASARRAGPTVAVPRLARLGEFFGRDRDRDLARLWIVPVGKREHGSIGQAPENSDDDKKTDETRHHTTRASRLTDDHAMKQRKNYDAFRPG